MSKWQGKGGGVTVAESCPEIHNSSKMVIDARKDDLRSLGHEEDSTEFKLTLN